MLGRYSRAAVRSSARRARIRAPGADDPDLGGPRVGGVDTEAVLRLLQDVAEEVVNPRFRSLSSGEIHEKGPGDLVTAADREAEQLITAALRAAYPDAVILGEEAYAGRSALLHEFWAADHAFTVDPVDGTKNFVAGSRDHAVMVGE